MPLACGAAVSVWVVVASLLCWLLLLRLLRRFVRRTADISAVKDALTWAVSVAQQQQQQQQRAWSSNSSSSSVHALATIEFLPTDR